MAEDSDPQEPFDPYAPPPPGRQPYGPPPQGSPYGQPPQGHPYGLPPQGQAYGQPPQGQPGHGYYYPQGYHTSYEPPPRQSSKPLWLGALLGLLLMGAVVYAAFVIGPDLFPWAAMGLLVALIVLIVVPVTRRWGLGILIGVFLSVPLGLIVFAGVCLVILAGYSQTGTG